MATYSAIDLMNQISEILNDGHLFVEVSELEAEDDYPASLSFEAEDGYFGIGYEGVEALSDDSDCKITITGKDCIAAFSLEEISLLHQAVSNALEYYKEHQNDASYSKEIRADMRSSAVATRNMQAKLTKLLKRFQ